nr:putative zinc finger, CCHC-type [Tanacetum cinerariifolium]
MDASTSSFQGGPKCKFCHKKGYTQKDCSKFKEWLAKKGIFESFMINESFNINVPINSWWIDSGSMVHIANYLQGFCTIRRLERNQQKVKVENGIDLNVEAIGTLSLILKGGFCLNLYGTLYVPSMTRNLISWVFKTKLDPNRNIERYKARLVAKGYTQKEGIDYKETFSLVSRKDCIRIVMALVAHFDLELHQMEVKTAFFNGNLHEDVYMAQPQGFKPKGHEHRVCKLKKSIYGIKQASRQWYLKFDEVMKEHNFIKNQVDQCVYLKMSGSNFIILVLYVDDIVLASNNIDLLHESKHFLSKNFDMKDLGEISYVIGIETHRDRANRKLELSQKAYIESVLNRFNMKHRSATFAPIIKDDVFGSHQCPKTEVEYEEMKRIPYASVVGSLTYAQVCTRPDIAYIYGM